MLQQRLGGELGFLQSTEESLRQLTDVERTRAVALAQQETVALAQIVKVSTYACALVVTTDRQGTLL